MLFASLPKYSDDREDLLTYLLTPHIIKAVDSYYGVPRGVWKINILEVKNLEPPGTFHFKVKVQAETFVGPHGPPHGLDMITFEFHWSEPAKVINYLHKDI